MGVIAIATSYATVTFEVISASDCWRPDWVEPANVVVTHIPYSNRDDVQDLGTGNPVIEVEAYIDSDAEYTTLKAARGMTKRTLTGLFGSNYSNVRLVEVSEPRRHESEARWRVRLRFMREGS